MAHTADAGTFLGNTCISSRVRQLHEIGSSEQVEQGGEIKAMQLQNVDISGSQM